MTTASQSSQTHYEELRSRVLAGRTLGSRLGLSLLLSSGMAAWIDAWSSCPLAPARPAVEDSSAELLPEERCGDVVSVLAGMALGNLLEARA